MTTKDDERKALDQIKKIIANLGSDSYIAAAIDGGVIRMAEDNIGNDFACSPSERIERLEKDLETAKASMQNAEEIKTRLAESRDAWREKAEKTEEKLEEIRKDLEAVKGDNLDLLREREKADAELEKAKTEIIELKARLYDYMTGGK